jgi:hypothetical protein
MFTFQCRQPNRATTARNSNLAFFMGHLLHSDAVQDIPYDSPVADGRNALLQNPGIAEHFSGIS